MATPELMGRVALYMTSLPCPPLPVVVTRREEDGVGNSHDLIARLLLNAMAADDQPANERRKVVQWAITKEWVERLPKTQSAEEFYALCCDFTCKWVNAFTGSSSGISFRSASSVGVGDPCHTALAHFMAAQDIQHLQQPALRKDFDHYSGCTYEALLTTYMQRLLN